MTELDRFHRYYYPVEPSNPQAIAVNRLTRDVITDRRGDATYPKYFTEDPDFENFCSGVLRFVAHNISFDSQFIPFMGRKKKLCTMMTNMDIVAVDFIKSKNEWKWPTLSETAVHYGILFSKSDLHGSMEGCRNNGRDIYENASCGEIRIRSLKESLNALLPYTERL